MRIEIIKVSDLVLKHLQNLNHVKFKKLARLTAPVKPKKIRLCDAHEVIRFVKKKKIN